MLGSQVLFVAKLGFSFTSLLDTSTWQGGGLDLVPCSCRQLCGRGSRKKCAPQTSTDDEIFPSVANLRLVREWTTVLCYKKWWRWEWMVSKDSPIFKSHQYQGVRENPQVFESMLQALSRGTDKFSFWGTAVMISLTQEITSRAC